MKVWITRTRPGADRTAGRVRALGHEPVVEPVLEVRPLPVETDLTDVGALAFTSANGVDAFARRCAERDLPVFVVGAATGAAATAAGFRTIRSAGGDVAELTRLIAEAKPASIVLHGAGRPRAGDLQAGLERAGVRARTLELYETTPRADLAPPPRVDAALAHSPHAARTLAAMDGADRALPVFCLSEAVASPLRAAGFTAVVAAERPDEAALLALLPPGLGATPERR